MITAASNVPANANAENSTANLFALLALLVFAPQYAFIDSLLLRVIYEYPLLARPKFLGFV
jgi:hypothetical protein